MLTKESLAKSLAEQEAKIREKREQLFKTDAFRADMVAEINGLEGSIQTLRWCIAQYEVENEKA